MSTQVVDSLARRVAGVSRRGSLMWLGMAGLAAATGSVSGEARKSRKNGRTKRKNQNENQGDRCPGQVEPCAAFITALCAGEPECLGQTSCCAFLERCDITTFLTCVANPS